MMMCPVCTGKSTVLDTRMPHHNEVIRRRRCVDCNARWNTTERLQGDVIENKPIKPKGSRKKAGGSTPKKLEPSNTNNWLFGTKP